MNKKTFAKFFITILIIIVFFTVYVRYFKKDNSLTNNQEQIKNNDKVIHNSNIIKDINYTSEDLRGNKYTVLAKEGEIDLSNTDIIFLKDVTAYIYLKKRMETITITSNFGKYNSINFDTIFSKNVIIDYIDNKITGEYLDYSMKKNLIIVSRNVVYKNLENILKADVIELNTTTKDTKIFMYNSTKKVNIKSIN
jgi:preprotein translocase subunit YajC